MDIKQLEHLAELSKLEFSQEELVNFDKDFENLINMVEKVKTCNISGERRLKVISMDDLREDEVVPSTSVEKLLKNSPDTKKDSVAVPRIME